MDKSLMELLRDTQMFLTAPDDSIVCENITHSEVMLQFGEVLSAIGNEILDLGQEPPIRVTMLGEHCRIELGALGTYAIPNTPESLHTVVQRLRKLATSQRFIRALHGFWPA